MLSGLSSDYFCCGVEFCSRSAFEELHVVLSKGPPCTTASRRQRRECNNTSVFLLRGHLRGWEKMKQGVDAHHLEPRLQAWRRAGFLPWLFFFAWFGHGWIKEEQCHECGKFGNELLSLEEASQELSKSRESLPGLFPKRFLRLRAPKPSQYIAGMNLQHGRVPRLEMASGLCYNPSAINGMFSLMQEHDVSFSRRNHYPSPSIVGAVKNSSGSKQEFPMGQYRQMP